MPFWVTAHEMGHQWWPHQVAGGNVQGSAFLSEGLSEYSAVSLLAQEKGDAIAGEALYKSNCAACHKLDKKGVGPALRNVAEKYERDWLYST